MKNNTYLHAGVLTLEINPTEFKFDSTEGLFFRCMLWDVL